MRLIFCAQIGEAGRDICESFLKVTWLLALQNLIQFPQTEEW